MSVLELLHTYLYTFPDCIICMLSLYGMGSFILSVLQQGP
jgi:hypothetical protein